MTRGKTYTWEHTITIHILKRVFYQWGIDEAFNNRPNYCFSFSISIIIYWPIRRISRASSASGQILDRTFKNALSSFDHMNTYRTVRLKMRWHLSASDNLFSRSMQKSDWHGDRPREKWPLARERRTKKGCFDYTVFVRMTFTARASAKIYLKSLTGPDVLPFRFKQFLMMLLVGRDEFHFLLQRFPVVLFKHLKQGVMLPAGNSKWATTV